MRDELKPCPFCGERPRLTLRPDNAEETAYFAAVACYCGGYSACAHKMATATNADEAEGKVRAAWNCRAAAQPPAAMPGWQWVPVEPTESMRQAGREYAECAIDANAVFCYRAMLAAAPTPQAQSAPATGAQPWQPIETAPRDGRKIIVAYVNRNSKVRTVMARWMTDEQAAETDSDGVGLEGGWYECIDNWDDYTEVAIHEGEPEHWMPLPTAPTGSATPQGDSNG